MKKVGFILVAVWAAAARAQQPPVTLTFNEALARALRVNNSVERSRADIAAAQANRQYLVSQVLPHITASGNAVRNSTQVTFGDTTNGDARTILSRNDWSYRVVLSQPLYAGRREFRAYSQALIGIQNAEQATLGTEDAVVLRVASNYLAVVNADARMAVEQTNIDIAQKRRVQSTAFYEAGESTKVDVLRADTSIKSAQRALAAIQQEREAAISRLRADLDLEGPINVVSSPHELPAVPDEQALIARAEAERPDVAVAVNNLRIAQLEVQKQRGFWLPTVTFDGGYISQKTTFPASNYSYGALRFTVPLLQSGEVEARVALAKDRELQATLDLESARTSVREDVRTALVSLHTATVSTGLANEQLAAAEAEYQQVFELYRAQEATSLDLATSEAALAEARRAVAQEALDRDLAQLRVWYVAGALRSAVGVSGLTPSLPSTNTPPGSAASMSLPAAGNPLPAGEMKSEGAVH